MRAFIEMSMRLGRLINQTAAGNAPQGRMETIRPALGPGFGDRGGVAGTPAPQLRLNEALTDDLAAGGFHVLTGECPPGPGPDRAQPRLPRFPGSRDWLETHGLLGVLVRPDGYVARTARTEAELTALGTSAPDLPNVPAYLN